MTQDRVTEERLREMLAGAAHLPAGPWKAVPWHIAEDAAQVRVAEGWLLCSLSADSYADYLAACDPATINSLITELLELRSGASRVPEGWVMVPREPTEAMITAGVKTFDIWGIGLSECEGIYRAMLDAVPQSTSAPGERNAVVEAAEIARHVSIYMIEDDMGWLHMKAFGHEIILCTPDSDTGIAVLKLASLLRLTEETPNA